MAKKEAKPKDTEETTDLIELSENLITTAYNDSKFEGVIKFIETQVDPARVYDMTNKKDMDDCRSNAHSIARSKSLIEKTGAAMIKAEKDKVKETVDSLMASKKSISAELADLQAEVRLPLTEWENIRSGTDVIIKEVNELADCLGLSSEHISIKLAALDDYDVMADGIVEDKLNEFLTATTKTREILTGQLDVAKIRQEEQAELQRLRDEDNQRKADEVKVQQESAQQDSAQQESSPVTASNVGGLSIDRRRDINNKLVADLVAFCGIDKEAAKRVVITVAQNKIAHLKIEY